MNIQKNVNYSALFATIDAAIQSGFTQMEKEATVATAAYIKELYPEMSGFSQRNLRRMRDFCRLYEESPEMVGLAMQIGWTQNVVILEAGTKRRYTMVSVCYQTI